MDLLNLEKNAKLEKMCNDFAEITKNYEGSNRSSYVKYVEPLLKKIIANIKDELPNIVIDSLQEANNILKKKDFSAKDVSKMKFFLLYLEENSAIYPL